MLIIDSETIMMLLLSRLTPKEAAPLLGSCKMLHSQWNISDTMSPSDYGRMWAEEYSKLYFPVKYGVDSIGRLLVCEYPSNVLLKTTITIMDERVYCFDDDFGVTKFTCSHKIRFFKQRGRKAVPIFSWHKTEIF